jgi:pimeloyl-ACP methyl ester carboxylesterase
MKPSIVFSHGIWADGSCFQKLIPSLRAEGHQVIAAQYGLDTLKGDVDATLRSMGRVGGPIVLVGHSYGGTVITHAGVHSRVAALVYIAALGPDETETSQGQQSKFPKTDVFNYIEVADGRVWQKPEDLERSAAKRMGAKTLEVKSSHVAVLSHPKLVLDVIREAARAAS